LAETSPRKEANKDEVDKTTDLSTAQQCQQGVNRKKNHYADLKDVKDYINWNHSFVATAQMQQTDKVLDKTYFPILEVNMGVFKEL
jgi:hypothetical protein